MIYLKWLLFCLTDILLLPVWFIGAFIVSIWTRPAPDLGPDTEPWGGWFGTYDNPPQGDIPWVTRRSPFPNIITGWKGYYNRVKWLHRNNGYGLNKLMGLTNSPDYFVMCTGNEDITDRDMIPGSYFAVCKDRNGKVLAFEYYVVLPWINYKGFSKCWRARLGWKIMSSKFTRYGFAPMVNTANPFKSYGGE